MAHVPLSISPFPITSEEHQIRRALSRSKMALDQITEQKNAILQKETELLQTIERYEQALAPYRKLNDESLLRIFTCLSEDYGPVVFPLPKQDHFLPQIVISQVCSRWRRVSLSARSIWSSVQIHKDVNKEANRRVYLKWLTRAGSYPVSLAINLQQLSAVETFQALSIIVQAVRVRALHIRSTFVQFEAMHLLESIISSLDGVKLAFTFVVEDNSNYDFRHQHCLLERASSIAFRGQNARVGIIRPGVHLPWAQLSYLDLHDFDDMTLQEATRILQQTPVVEVLHLAFQLEPANIDGVEKVTLSCLRRLTLRLCSVNRVNTVNNAFLRAFECPKLVEFNLFTKGDWSPETYSLLKRQYNLENLEQLDMIAYKSLGCCLPMSAILRDAPVLRRLGLTEGVIVDDDAIIGIATGTLGRCLSYIWFRGMHNLVDAFDMVLSRQKNGCRLISESTNWKEDITLFREICVDYGRGYPTKTVTLLGEAGVKFRIICPSA